MTKLLRWPTLRYAGWLLFGLYILLAGVGRMLEITVASTPWGPPGPPTVDGLLNSLVLALWAFAGALLIDRLPRNPFGWLFITLALLMASDEFAYGYTTYGAIMKPGALPNVGLANAWLYWSGRVLAALCVTFLFGLFPTGRPLSAGWSKFLWFNVAIAVLYILTAAISPLPIVNLPLRGGLVEASGIVRTISGTAAWILYGLLIFGAIAATSSLVIRFRRSQGVERQQLKWFVFAALFFIPGIILIIVGILGSFNAAPAFFTAGAILLLIMMAGIPVASAIAILRYNLFDIDIIIQRTLVYSLLTGLLALIYFGLVVLLQALFSASAGQSESPLITVISTLVIASLFSPLRQRVQVFIDRRFFRQKYDARQVLARFARAARDETDKEALTADLQQVVQETMQPETVSIWFRQ